MIDLKLLGTEKIEPNTKIAAFYGDGSGANFFIVKNDDNLTNPEFPDEHFDADELTEMGYCFFDYLPNDFKIWGED